MTGVGLLSGQLFDIDDPTPEAIHLDDIVQGLGRICRWGGQMVGFWSVADHSRAVGQLVRSAGGSDREVLAGLLHDAHEAYIGDRVSPTKRKWGRTYAETADDLDAAIAPAFGLRPSDLHGDLVKAADRAMLHAEGECFRPNGPDLGPVPDGLARDLYLRARWGDVARELGIAARGVAYDFQMAAVQLEAAILEVWPYAGVEFLAEPSFP